MIKRGTWISRKLPKLRLRALGMATIKDIPTAEFVSLIKSLKSEGWCIADEYYNGGVLDHYSKIKLTRNSSKLSLEWDNKQGGSIEGAEVHVHKIARSHGYKTVDKGHWLQKDRFVA